MRHVLVEAAWSAVHYSSVWKQRFEGLVPRLGNMRAIVAIARKLLVVIWHVSSERVADRQADVAAVSRYPLSWATRYRLAAAQGLSRAAFVQQGLRRLGLPVDTSLPRAPS